MMAHDRLRAQLVAELERHLRHQDRPQVPEAGHLLWRAFMELDGTRTFHAAGPNPISFAEIEAWARLMRYPLAPRHVSTIRAMDAALLVHVAERAEKAAAKAAKARRR